MLAVKRLKKHAPPVKMRLDRGLTNGLPAGCKKAPSRPILLSPSAAPPSSDSTQHRRRCKARLHSRRAEAPDAQAQEVAAVVRTGKKVAADIRGRWAIAASVPVAGSNWPDPRPSTWLLT